MWRLEWHRHEPNQQGFDVECPGGHEDCTSNLYRAAPLSEYEMGKALGEQLGLQNILIRYVTTDGDGRSAKGIKDAMKALHPMWKVQRLADPVHLGQSQFRASMKARYSDGMFPGRTKEQRTEMKNVKFNSK